MNASKDTDQKDTDQKDTQFMIQRLYVKDLSFETKNSPAVFREEWKPDLTVDLHTENSKLEDGVFEVVLTVTTTVKNSDKVAFLVEVKQAGIFTVKGVEDEQMGHLLGSFCPSMLFPYAREAISAEVNRGSFPQLILAPINFDALYMQQLEKKKAEKVN